MEGLRNTSSEVCGARMTAQEMCCLRRWISVRSLVRGTRSRLREVFFLFWHAFFRDHAAWMVFLYDMLLALLFMSDVHDDPKWVFCYIHICCCG